MAYSKTTWANDTTPAINANNLNKIEQGIFNADEAVNAAVNIIVSPNKFDSSTITSGKRLANDGTLITESGYATSDYIDISGLTKTYIAASVSTGYQGLKVCFYNSSKTFISYDVKNIGTGYNPNNTLVELTVPANTKYLRFHYVVASVSKQFIGYYAVPSEYVYSAYGRTYENYPSEETKAARDTFGTLGQRLDSMTNGIDAATTNIVDINGEIDAIANIKKYTNLFNIATVIDGKQLYNDGSIGNASSYSVSDYVDISGLSVGYIACTTNTGNQTLRICFYNSSKTYIANSKQEVSVGISGTYPNDTLIPLIIPSGAVYLRFHYITASTTGQFIGTWDNPSAYEYIPYGSRYIVSENELKYVEYWGDSLTQGNQDGTGVERATVLKELLGNDWTIKNYGVGGEASNAISARASGIFAIITPNITIPADGTTVNLTDHLIDIFGNDVAFGNGIYSKSYKAWITVNPCYVDGVECVLQKANASSPITIKRKESGSAITINRPTYIKTNSQDLEKGHLLLICVGQNEGFDRNADQLISQIDGIIESRKADRFIVYGMPHSLSGYTWQAEFNEKLKTKYGKNYFDIEAYMKTPIYQNGNIVSSYALEDAGLTPTAQDLTNIAEKKYPPSIMYDAIHFNKYGYTVWANVEYKLGQWLGYW